MLTAYAQILTIEERHQCGEELTSFWYMPVEISVSFLICTYKIDNFVCLFTAFNSNDYVYCFKT